MPLADATSRLHSGRSFVLGGQYGKEETRPAPRPGNARSTAPAAEMAIAVTTGPCGRPNYDEAIWPATRTAARQRRTRRPGTRRRRAGDAPQRLRLPPRSQEQLHPRADRPVRARQHDREVRPPRRACSSAAWSSPAAASKARGCAKSSTSTACRPRNTRTSRPSTSSRPSIPSSWLRLETGPEPHDHPGHGPAHAAWARASGR